MTPVAQCILKETFRSNSICCASKVVGPLAPSTITLALIRGALSAVITVSNAHGHKISQSSSNKDGPLYGSAPGKPTTELFCYNTPKMETKIAILLCKQCR